MSKSTRVMEFVKAFFVGGTETQVLALLRGLPRHYEVEVGVNDDIGPLRERVYEAGFWPHEFPLGKSFVSPQGLFQIARLARFLKQKQIELLHAHDFYSTLVSVPAAKASGVPVVISRLDLLHWHGPKRASVLRELTRMADHVIANAEIIRRHLIDKEQIPPHRISVIRNGLDLPKFDAERANGVRKPLPETNGEPILVHLANMGHEVKRQEDVLQALPLLLERFGPVHVFFIGDGDRRPMLERLAETLGIRKYAHFLGFRHDTPAILSQARVGILCSRFEGLSNAIMEGMAARVPMVVTNVGGNPELISDGERGLLVPACDPEALSEALDSLLRAPDLAKQMGENARRFVEGQLSLEQMVQAHDAVYQGVLKMRQGRQFASAAVFG